VGKGVCFDSGGLNLKPTGYMETMYQDKHGACNVLSIFKAVSSLGLKVNLSATMGFVENSVSHIAYRPSDIIESYKGLTVEIGNTDAEGRLVLADIMTWAQELESPTTMIEFSTLTGACMVALGESTAGLFSNDSELVKQLLSSAEEEHEGLWSLPIN